MTPLTEAEIPGLVIRLRNQDPEAIEKATLGLTRLGLQIVGRYLAVMRSDSLADDLVGAALEGIVDAVHRVSTSEAMTDHDNLRGFVVSTIHRYISEQIEKHSMVHVPGRTMRRKRKAGADVLEPSRIDFDDPRVIRYRADYSREREFEITDLLERAIESDEEREILRLRQEGFGDQEIAEQMGLSKTTVFVIRRGLETRFLEQLYA